MIELTHDDIIEAIGFLLEARGASADLGTIKFLVGEEGLCARLEGDLAEQEEPVPPAVLKPSASAEEVTVPGEPVEVEHLEKEEMLDLVDRLNGAGMFAALANAQRLSKDSFTGEEIDQGTELVWIEGVGATRAPLEKWPATLRKKLGIKEESEARTASDILGSGGAPLDRSDALSKGMKG